MFMGARLGCLAIHFGSKMDRRRTLWEYLEVGLGSKTALEASRTCLWTLLGRSGVPNRVPFWGHWGSL